MDTANKSEALSYCGALMSVAEKPANSVSLYCPSARGPCKIAGCVDLFLTVLVPPSSASIELIVLC